ncbi:MAG: tetratricopeptide repeat protein [Bacteroidales bacterium]|jgi:tetratricopeptide (TPR) repeat protein|nr:tetratricopeptide repeat protein [Bacteroidales bacterium]
MIKNIIFSCICFILFSSCHFEQESKKETVNYDTLVNQGQIYTANNDIDSAIVIYKKAIKIKKKSGEALYGLGVAYMQNCVNQRVDCEEAIKLFNKVVKIEPNYKKLYYNRAVCKEMIFEYESAIADMDTLISRNDTNPDFFKKRAQLKIFNKDTIGACEDYTRSRELGNSQGQQSIDIICQ